MSFGPPEKYSRQDLLDLIAQLRTEMDAVVDECVHFFVAESRGLWHGRARAGMARVLLNQSLGNRHQAMLVDAVGRRLKTGEFSEQFKDQLNMAIRLAPDVVKGLADELLEAQRPYVRRYADWTFEENLANRGQHQDDHRPLRRGEPGVALLAGCYLPCYVPPFVCEQMKIGSPIGSFFLA